MNTIITDTNVGLAKNNRLSKTISAFALAGLVFSILSIQGAMAQESLAPPGLGEDTKGVPAVAERQPLPVQTSIETIEETTEGEDTAATEEDEENFGPLGQAIITETRRESGGQIYRVELEHSIGGGKQILEENDSDGQLEKRTSGLEEEFSIPKWRIGSWGRSK